MVLPLFVVSMIIFGGWFPGAVKTYPLAYMCLPFLLWSALRFEPRVVSTSILLMAGIAIWGASQGYGPFIQRDPNVSLLLLLTFIGVSTLMALILANAVKFTPQHGVIDISLGLQNSQAEIGIEDSGPGVPVDFLARIFERFTQADGSTTRKHGGLGLGLAIVQHLVELHGGTVEAGNRDAKGGAVLTVRLPANGDAT